MGYTAKAIANYFLEKHGEAKISPLKLQKLVYISHGWHLGLFDEPLVDDEYAEAWQYGPVFPSLYYEFKEFGSDPVDRLAKDYSGPNFDSVMPKIKSVDTLVPELLSKVWEGYGHLTAIQLSALTHAQGTPWYKTWHGKPGWRNLHISNDEIKAYYKERVEKLKTDG